MSIEATLPGFNSADRDCSRSGLNFSTSMGGYHNENPAKKARVSRDPLSHRIIEKRRRDRMNNSLADLSQVIPQRYLKQGHGRIEKTEIIEMAINHIKELKATNGQKFTKESFWLGYKESIDEVMRYLVEVQNYQPSHKLCVDLLKHLNLQSRKYYPGGLQEEMENDNQAEEASFTKNNATNKVVNSLGLDVAHSSQSEYHAGGDNSYRIQSPFTKPWEDSEYYSAAPLYTSMECDKPWIVQEDFKETGEPPPLPLSYITDSSDSEVAKASASAWESHDGGSRHSGSSTVYKFKNDIKLRFTNGTSIAMKQDPAASNDTTSCLSLNYPSETISFLRKEKSIVASPGSVSSGYQTSEMQSSSARSNGSESPFGNDVISRKRRLRRSHSSTQSGKCVPGFALHPNHSYYIPIVISTEQLRPYLQQYDESSPPGVSYHPISIPVNFASSQFVPVQCEGSQT